MALDLSGFAQKEQQWEGLYKATEQLGKQKEQRLKSDQDKRTQRLASTKFLQDYLNPKDHLTGTAYDPTMVKGLNDLMAQGTELAMMGADPTTLSMALGPQVNKISTYSAKAKALNTQIDDQIKKMKESGYGGFDYAKLKELALDDAFYDVGEDGQKKINPEKADLTTNWIQKAINDKPELVSTGESLEEYVKKAPLNKTLKDITIYDSKGKTNRQKAHLIGPSWSVPETDAAGVTTGMVPRYDVAYDGQEPLMQIFKDSKGNEVNAPMRLLDEGEYDRLLSSSPGNYAAIKAATKRGLQAYEKETGQKIDIDSPRGKLFSRAIAYDELKARMPSTIESAGIVDKPSAQQVTLNVGSSPEYLEMLEDQAEARKRGRNNVPNPEDEEKKAKNPIRAIGKIFGGDPEYTNGPREKVNGKDVINITSALPGGGLKKGRGEDETFKSVYYDPSGRSLIVEMEEKDKYGRAKRKNRTVAEGELGPFLYEIAEANGVSRSSVKALLGEIGYKNGAFAVEEKPTVESSASNVKGAVTKIKEGISSFFKPSTPAATKPAKPAKGKYD